MSHDRRMSKQEGKQKTDGLRAGLSSGEQPRPSLPEHRRIEKSEARVRCANRRGSISLIMTLKDEAYVHALERHVHLVHETFLLFLVVTGQAAVPITCAVSGKDGRDYSRTAFCLPIDQLPVR